MAIIKTAYYQSQGVYTVKAYVLDGNTKHSYTTASEDNLADASERAIRQVKRLFQSDGLTPPHEVMKTGKQPRAFVDAYKF